jgi:hypothetical protein
LELPFFAADRTGLRHSARPSASALKNPELSWPLELWNRLGALTLQTLSLAKCVNFPQ